MATTEKDAEQLLFNATKELFAARAHQTLNIITPAAKGALKAKARYASLGTYERSKLYVHCLDFYAAPNRVYHDRVHLDTMLSAYDEVYGHSPSDEMFVAMLFHDAIWMPDNSPTVENMSIQSIGPTFKIVLNQKIRPTLLERAGILIRQTYMAHHMTDRTTSGALHPEALRILDMDLCAMAADWQHFVHTQHRVMAELSFGRTQRQLAVGGNAFLGKLLDRGFVFYTPQMSVYNKKALTNIMAFSHLMEIGLYGLERQLAFDPRVAAASYMKRNDFKFNEAGHLIDVQE